MSSTLVSIARSLVRGPHLSSQSVNTHSVWFVVISIPSGICYHILTSTFNFRAQQHNPHNPDSSSSRRHKQDTHVHTLISTAQHRSLFQAFAYFDSINNNVFLRLMSLRLKFIVFFLCWSNLMIFASKFCSCMWWSFALFSLSSLNDGWFFYLFVILRATYC